MDLYLGLHIQILFSSNTDTLGPSITSYAAEMFVSIFHSFAAGITDLISSFK